MSKNKLYNRSYFCKRLIESGFNILKLNIPYESEDARKWSIVVVNSKTCEYKHNILITCFKNEKTKEFSFKFQGKDLNAKGFTLNTLSMNIIIEILKRTFEKHEETVKVDNEQQETELILTDTIERE
jgi:hypothetical protein